MRSLGFPCIPTNQIHEKVMGTLTKPEVCRFHAVNANGCASELVATWTGFCQQPVFPNPVKLLSHYLWLVCIQFVLCELRSSETMPFWLFIFIFSFACFSFWSGGYEKVFSCHLKRRNMLHSERISALNILYTFWYSVVFAFLGVSVSASQTPHPAVFFDLTIHSSIHYIAQLIVLFISEHSKSIYGLVGKELSSVALGV